MVAAILEAHDLRVMHVSDVNDLLNKQWSHFPFDKTYEEAYLKPLFTMYNVPLFEHNSMKL